jgi:nitrate reductase assembly molybdenum cofactor insertion protein NarJ
VTAPLDDELLESAVRFSLASLLTSYPDPAQGPRLVTLTEWIGGAGLPEAVRRLALDEADRQEARSEYIDLFDRGAARNPIYETEYGLALTKGAGLARLAGFYRAFGLSHGEAGALPEMPDHLAVELEFYGVLSTKQAHLEEAGDAEGGDIVRAARRGFLGEHLGPLAGAVASRPGVVASPRYGSVLSWCLGLVEAECAALGLPMPPPPRLLRPTPERDGVTCQVAGDKHLPVLQ